MFTLDGIRQFHAWTHASLTLLLDHVATLSSAEYTTPLPGFGEPSIHTQVVHLIACEGRWINRLRSLPGDPPDPARWPAVSDARILQSEARAVTLDYLSRLTDQQLNTPLELRLPPDGVVGYRTPALILHHVFTHAFHHKGQIVAMCRLLDHPAPITDLFQFQ